jgi:hypothetical protein
MNYSKTGYYVLYDNSLTYPLTIYYPFCHLYLAHDMFEM